MCPEIEQEPGPRWDTYGWDLYDEDEYLPESGFPGPMALAIIGALLVILILWACLTIPAA